MRIGVRGGRIVSRNTLSVLFLSPEGVPFAKTGGLGDVAGALPPALSRLGADVRLALPFYRTARKQEFETRIVLEGLQVPLGDMVLRADVLETRLGDDVPVYLIVREDLYDRPNLYGNAEGDYYDNLERFAFFCHAALRLASELSLAPDIIHCHDWQTGLVPPLLRGPYGKGFFPVQPSTVFTIHNLGYQGVFGRHKFSFTGLPEADFLHMDGLEFWGNMSLLKAGILYADAVTTVSPTYAREIQTPDYGMGMEGILQGRSHALHGILNGVDYRIWNPATDVHIPARYSRENPQAKLRCKTALVEETGLVPDLVKAPLLGMISRLDMQKGLNLLIAVIDDLMNAGAGLVLLGSGEAGIQEALKAAAERHKGRICVRIGFDEPLAHRIMAGTDIFLIPSRYEPCGLTQMYALKYGTVPVVRATGGLDDTITPYDPSTGNGNGIKFKPYDARAFLDAVRQAMAFFQKEAAWKRLLSNGMSADFSWDRSAKSYLELYKSVRKG